MRRYCNLLFVLLFFSGCAVTPVSVSKHKTMQLSQMLQSLGNDISVKESISLSHNIFHHTSKLTKKFKLTSPPIFHNFLVNVGAREKGLCYHWSDALYEYLSKKEYFSFEFHLVGANIGEYFFEHNALVVTAKKGDLVNAVLIDPWRDSGKLYFSKVKDDKKYQWFHRPSRGCNKQLGATY